MGYYNRKHNCAIVIECCKPTSDSKFGKSDFYRGIMGLQKWLLQLWNARRRRYYLGEWHYHPHNKPCPSKSDIDQMSRIAADKKYNCPQPIMFIVGGNPKREIEFRGFVYVKNEGLVELARGWEKDSGIAQM